MDIIEAIGIAHLIGAVILFGMLTREQWSRYPRSTAERPKTPLGVKGQAKEGDRG